MKKYSSKLITLLFVVAFAYYGLTNKDSFSALSNVTIVSMLLIALGRCLMFLSNGLFTKWTAEAFTRKLTVGEGTYVGILSAIGNFFGPLLGGASIRAVYLKKVHNLSYSKFTSTLMGYYLILFTANALCAISALVFIDTSAQRNLLLTVFIGWFLILVAMMFIKLPKKEKAERISSKKIFNRLVKIVYEIEDGWRTISSNKKLLVRLATLAIFNFAAILFMSFIEFRALNIGITLPSLVLYTSFISVSLLISLTPGAIGVRETMLFFISSTLMISAAEILQVAVIDRGVNFILLLILFAITRSKRLKKLLTSREVNI